MATIKVFDVHGCKELNCFDTLTAVDYLDDEVVIDPDVVDDGSLLVGSPIQ